MGKHFRLVHSRILRDDLKFELPGYSSKTPKASNCTSTTTTTTSASVKSNSSNSEYKEYVASSTTPIIDDPAADSNTSSLSCYPGSALPEKKKTAPLCDLSDHFMVTATLDFLV